MNSHLKIAQGITDLLERKFSFLGFRFGLDPILGVFPWFGDLLSLILSAYIIWIAYKFGVPGKQISYMWRNVLVDFLIGSVPIIGDIADLFYKANTKNMAILKQYANKNIIEGSFASA